VLLVRPKKGALGEGPRRNQVITELGLANNYIGKVAARQSAESVMSGVIALTDLTKHSKGDQAMSWRAHR
jgi:hypothetical protein